MAIPKTEDQILKRMKSEADARQRSFDADTYKHFTRFLKKDMEVLKILSWVSGHPYKPLVSKELYEETK